LDGLYGLAELISEFTVINFLVENWYNVNSRCRMYHDMNTACWPGWQNKVVQVFVKVQTNSE
jgi:hypothetical protein